MLYFNLIWIWGHPEVYILVLPAFGVFSEVTSTFCGKRLFGYTSMVYALVVIITTSPTSCGCTTSSPWARAPT